MQQNDIEKGRTLDDAHSGKSITMIEFQRKFIAFLEQLDRMQGSRKMRKFRWTPEMSVGVPALDSDHRCLIRIINLLEGIQQAEVGLPIEIVLETLLLYSRFHFNREERLMNVYGFPAAGFHASEHQVFADYIRNLSDRLAGEPNADIVSELLEYLTEWLCHHILIQDMAYKPYFISDDPGASTRATAAENCLSARVDRDLAREFDQLEGMKA